MNELPLRDIHLPPHTSWWPPAIGWWVLLGLVIALFFVYKYLTKSSLRKEATEVLDRIEREYHQHGDASESLRELSALLRRVVLSQQGSEKSAGITGQEWLKLLDKNLGESEFSEGAGQHLLTGPYDRFFEKQNVPEIIQLCRKWVSRL